MKAKRFISTMLPLALWLSAAVQPGQAQQPTSTASQTEAAAAAISKINPSTLLAQAPRGRWPGFGLMPASRHLNGSIFNITPAVALQAPAVLGSGTVGKISMWTGTGPSGNSLLGDSIITQSSGNIGIGLATPTSKLTVLGMIETTLGGYKFPDGTVQTTAGLTSIFHDATLAGDGTAGSPLGVAVPLNLSGAFPWILNVTNTSGHGVIANGGVGGLVGSDGVQGSGGIGSGIGGHGVNATGGFGTINGGSAVFAFGGLGGRVGGNGVEALGGFSSGPGSTAGAGVRATGGIGAEGGGIGVQALGASTIGPINGGIGVEATGGGSTSGLGGDGVSSRGGSVFEGVGGVGVKAKGGDSLGSFGGDAGHGVEAKGGNGDRAAGKGMIATGGNSQLSFGGIGVEARGGDTQNVGFPGGDGVVATGGYPRGRGVVATGADVDAAGGGATFASVGVVATGGAVSDPLRTGGVGVLARGGAASGPNSLSGHGIIAIFGHVSNGADAGSAGVFQGRVDIAGDLVVSGDLNVTHGTKNFKIDHPLDPENKYLLHASIESSEVLNVYSGNVVTDTKGEAVVTLPDWFEALNRDLRYQLSVIGTFAQAIVAEKVKQNRFKIRTSAPNVEVSWQVTGVRSDRALRKHQFRAEEEKPERERGTYINPEAYDKPEERGVEWARSPELMQELKQQRLQAEQTQRYQKQTGRLILGRRK